VEMRAGFFTSPPGADERVDLVRFAFVEGVVDS
jgi:hypothetical protein